SVVFAAPDVASDVFSFSVPRAAQVAERLTLYACRWDLALFLSEAASRFERAGQVGVAGPVTALDLDTIEVLGRMGSINHSYVMEHSRVRDDVSQLLGEKLSADRRGLTPVSRRGEGIAYWRIP